MPDDRERVPCGACRSCCRQTVTLLPEHGDDIAAYETLPFVSTIKPAFLAKMMHDLGEDVAEIRMLKRQENGDCWYLDEATGCTIWERAPYLCRIFDCRQFYRRFSRTERKRLLAKGELDRAIIKAGRERLKTLGDDHDQYKTRVSGG